MLDSISTEILLPRLIPLLALLLLAACARAPSLEQVLARGEIRVVMLHGTAPFYENENGPGGLERDLAERFAARLGVTLTPLVVDTEEEMLELLTSGAAHLAAAGLPVTRARSGKLRFGPAYQDDLPRLIYRVGSRKPEHLGDLGDGRLSIPPLAGHNVQLGNLRNDHPDLEWQVAEGTSTLELLRRVNDGELEFTIAYEHELETYRHLYPDLRTAFELGEHVAFAWALPPGDDNSLLDEVEAFFSELSGQGELVRLIDHHFGHFEDFDYVDIRAFQRRIDERLPELEPLFVQASGDDIDWRLLAAIGYQESHWNPKAKSPTGVRGLMMLTLDAAEQMGVSDRLDPSQSIHGGAAYLRWVRDRVPERIAEPDRTWMTLATYNIGYGHLEDARILTQRRGGDPDRWSDVRKTLPLLEQEAHYKELKRGFARGREAVSYVEKIRTYHDILIRKQYLEQHPPATAVARSRLLPRVTPLAL